MSGKNRKPYLANKNQKVQEEQFINININDIPPENKELIKCECGSIIFIGAVQWYKLKADNEIKYGFINVTICLKCHKILPEKP